MPALTDFRALLDELDHRVPTREEALFLMRSALGDAPLPADGAPFEQSFDAPRPGAAEPEALDALCATAARVRDREMAGCDELEAGINNVVPCRLRPLCRYCPYWRGAGARVTGLDELLSYVRYLREQTDIRQFHLSGGSLRGGSDCGIVGVVEAIRAAGFDDMRVVVNCGASLSDQSLQRLAQLGVLRVFSVVETTDPDVFVHAKPGDDLAEKLDFAQRVARAGIAVGTGLMAGLATPHTRCEEYVRSVFDVTELSGLAAMYISRFRPVPGIEMAAHPECPIDEARALVALARLVLRDVHIRAAAGWRPSERALADAAGTGSLSATLMFPRPEPGERSCWGD